MTRTPLRTATLTLALAAALAAAAPAATAAPAGDTQARVVAETAPQTHYTYGHVKGFDDTMWSNVEVSAIRTTTGATVATAVSDDLGFFTFNLPDGKFIIQYHDLDGRAPDRVAPYILDFTVAQVPDSTCLGPFKMTRGDLANTAAPTIVGSPRVGSVLTARPGEWSVSDGTTYDYQWFSGGDTEGYDRTLQLYPQDLGEKIRVQVTAENPQWSSAAVYSTYVTIGKARTSITATAPKRVARNHVVPITAAVVDHSWEQPYGDIYIYENGRMVGQGGTYGTDGIAHLKVYGLAPGKHTLSVRWPGSDVALPSAAKVNVTVAR